MSWLLSALDDWAELRKIEEGSAGADASLVRVDGVIEPVKALIIARLARASDKPILVICPTAETAERTYEDIRALAPDDVARPDDAKAILLPSLEALLFEDVSPDPRLVGDRQLGLRKLLDGEPVIIVASAAAAFQRCPPPDVLRAAFLSLRLGQAADRDELVQRLVELGYEREDMVDTAGEIGVRGGVIDIFPVGADWPVRVELFGDEIDSIRTFDPANQLSISPVESVTVLPAREVLLSNESVERAVPLIEAALAEQARALRSNGKDMEAERLEARIRDIVQALQQKVYVRGLEYFLPFLYPEQTNLLDYLPSGATAVVDEPGRVEEHYSEFLKDLLEVEISRLDQGLLLPLPGPLHLPLDHTFGKLEERRVVELCLIGADSPRRPAQRVAISSQSITEFAGNLERLAAELRRWQKLSERVLIATRQADRLIEMLDESKLANIVREQPGYMPKPGQVVISTRPLNHGFHLPTVGLVAVTDREIFGWRRLRRPIRRRAAEGVPIGSLTDLNSGDYVVHINHGIGIYRGLVRRQAEGGEREFLLVEYAGNDRLYVPTDQFDRVQKYLGGEEERPQVNRLGGSEWERTKRRAKKSALELAGELVRIYSARQQQPGHAFGSDTPWQREMEDGFEFEETPDQLTAIDDVKRDMETPRPMDRLICGDVGYGKTEVAIRAAFKAVMDGKQVAVLVPTTVLAQQHFTTFSERLLPYPVKVALLSRFRSRKEQLLTVADIAAGAVDIVIGTHRLLSKDVSFKDLGLVIVDEEQRFGVRHKEKLKQFRATVDVLTMTATPIPRTLHMSLSGIRDMSLINDPPEGRTAIITRAMERDDRALREAVMRELDRGGQVYYLHNRIESIGHVAEHLRQVVPHARYVIAHGQMEERQLESAMLDFYTGEAQVLVCTTIVENGLDIPNANTLVVSDADRLGLAQLYQIRGRVGRSNRQAYAYLMWTPFKRLTEQAEKRISAIKEFSDLGSGIKVAMRDLEIRGAGNLLGPEQHGFATSVGFELFMQMLQDAVHEAKGEAPAPRPEVSIDIPVEAYLPEDYAPDLNQRIDLYRRLATAPDSRRIDALEMEIEDRYGRPVPEPVRNLVRMARLKVRCAVAGIETLATEGNLIVLRLADDRRLTPPMAQKLQRGLRPETRIWLAMTSHDRVVVSRRKADADALFTRLEEALEQLALLPLDEEARRYYQRERVIAGR
ncbi:MAG: transcription-repair coupling factor [Armatimonadota bacterium]